MTIFREIIGKVVGTRTDAVIRRVLKIAVLKQPEILWEALIRESLLAHFHAYYPNLLKQVSITGVFQENLWSFFRALLDYCNWKRPHKFQKWSTFSVGFDNYKSIFLSWGNRIWWIKFKTSRSKKKLSKHKDLVIRITQNFASFLMKT